MMDRIKAEITNIIVENAIRGRAVPLWIRILFPGIVREIYPVAQMLSATTSHRHQTEQTRSSFLPKLIAATATAAIILVGIWFNTLNQTPASQSTPPTLHPSPKAVERSLPPTQQSITVYDGTTATTATTEIKAHNKP